MLLFVATLNPMFGIETNLSTAVSLFEGKLDP